MFRYIIAPGSADWSCLPSLVRWWYRGCLLWWCRGCLWWGGMAGTCLSRAASRSALSSSVSAMACIVWRTADIRRNILIMCPHNNVSSDKLRLLCPGYFNFMEYCYVLIPVLKKCQLWLRISSSKYVLLFEFSFSTYTRILGSYKSKSFAWQIKEQTFQMYQHSIRWKSFSDTSCWIKKQRKLIIDNIDDQVWILGPIKDQHQIWNVQNPAYKMPRRQWGQCSASYSEVVSLLR